MSDDEIQFEEVSYREPLKALRPDLDARLACVAYRVPGPEDMPIFLDKKPADAIERHALRDVSVELGGILLGKECVDEVTGLPFVWVTECLEAKHYENTQASFTYTHDSWEEMTRARDAQHPDLDIVGWYHTHPDFGIFLSSHDLFIHHNFFDQPLQVAYVVDPIRQDRGFFHWRDGRMVQTGGFYLCAGRAERMGLARLANDLEGIPTADGGGGGSGLSPVLEAELIAMLSRPQTVAMPADRGQSAAVFTLLGMLAGSLGVILLLWIRSLGADLQEQTAQIKALAEAQKASTASLSGRIESERISAKEAALDGLLGELKLDPAAAKGVKVSDIVGQRDAARREADRLRLEKEALSNAALVDRERALSARDALDTLKEKTAADRARDDKEYNLLKADRDKLKGESDEKDRLVRDNVSGSLERRYFWAWWLAVAGWVSCLALSLWLGAALLGRGRDDEDRADDRPQHTISIT